MKRFVSAVMTAFLFAGPVSAITLEPGQSADFVVDFSGIGDFQFRRWGYACNDPVACASGASGQLAGGATITFMVGSSVGASDYRLVTYSPLAGVNVDAISVPLLGVTLIPAAVQTVFVRIGAVDDSFVVNSVVLSEGIGKGSGVGSGGTMVPVPAPASGGLAVLGLIGLAALRRRIA